MIKTLDLEKQYGHGENTVRALYALNLEVPAGDFLAVMGPSGSGKSTLMNMLGCLDTPTRGKYYLDGVDTAKLSSNALAYFRNDTIGFVFQSFFLLPKLTAAQNLEMPLMYADVPPQKRRRRVMDMLEKLNLLPRAQHLPGELSGGQCQRIAIGRALINDPKLILADEPTGSLDSATGEEIMVLFHQAHQNGCTIVLITHEQEIARHAARTLYLRDGTVEKPLKAQQARLPGEVQAYGIHPHCLATN